MYGCFNLLVLTIIVFKLHTIISHETDYTVFPLVCSENREDCIRIAQKDCFNQQSFLDNKYSIFFRTTE